MYLAQVSRYNILYAMAQLARGMPEPSKAKMGASKHLSASPLGRVHRLLYHTYKRGGFKFGAFSNANSLG